MVCGNQSDQSVLQFVPSSSSSLKNSSLSLAEWDFFISAIRFRGTLRLSDGEKKEGRFLSGVGGVLKDVTCRRTPVRHNTERCQTWPLIGSTVTSSIRC